MGLPRLFKGLVLGALAMCATAAAAPAAEPVRIVAIGDLHGDYAAWRAILSAARLTDSRGRWAGGSATLVQTGDVTDRGPDSLKIIRHMMALEREALRSRGRVIVLLGNHEAMNVTGDLRYVSAGEFAAFADRDSGRRRDAAFAANRARIEAFYRARDASMSPAAMRDAWNATMPLGKVEHRLAWQPSGELGQWAIARPAVVVIGGTLFVHGGISERYAAIPIDDINRRVAAALAVGETTAESILEDPAGPLWYRGLIVREPEVAPPPPPTPSQIAPGAPKRPSIDEELTIVLRAARARRIVVGHTPITSSIAITQSDRLIRIDTGISRAYGGKLSFLEIKGDIVVPHVVERSP